MSDLAAVSTLWMVSSSTPGRCKIGNCTADAVQCQMVLSLTMQVAAGPPTDCPGGAKIVGPNAPGGVCLPGFQVTWLSPTVKDDCSKTSRLSYSIQDAAGNLLFTFDPGMQCGTCTGS